MLLTPDFMFGVIVGFFAGLVIDGTVLAWLSRLWAHHVRASRGQ